MELNTEHAIRNTAPHRVFVKEFYSDSFGTSF
jgi:hypothetical protein